MSRPQSDYIIESTYRRIKEAWAQYRAAGFDPTLHSRYNDGPWQRLAAQWFNRALLWKVFRLAEIVLAEQPLTVRRCMYVGIGSLFKDSGDYDSCQRALLQMRRAGLIPFESITDLTRERIQPATWRNVAEYAEWCALVYQKDLWQNQDEIIEVFIEKEAMVGVVEPETRGFRVSLIPSRGQCSETWCWSIAQDWNRWDKPIVVFYIGDFDPDGLSIERSMRERITGYLDLERKDCFSWERLAVTRADFSDQRNLGFPVKPKLPVKVRQAWIEQYGDRCVEADAISPIEIRRRVHEAIAAHIDQEKWNQLLAMERRERAEIKAKLSRLR